MWSATAEEEGVRLAFILRVCVYRYICMYVWTVRDGEGDGGKEMGETFVYVTRVYRYICGL
jgi:hypothetical protein